MMVMFVEACLFLAAWAITNTNPISGTATTTHYYDCCRPSSSYPDKAAFTSNLKIVTASGGTADVNAASGCQENVDLLTAGFADPAQQPSAVDDMHAIGYAAVGQLNGLGERDTACACFDLTFTNTAIAGKIMTVQVVNTGGDLGRNHFDIEIAGGGAGIFTQGCPRQFGSQYKYGAQYGGVASISECLTLPPALQPGCNFRFNWFKNADNPNVSFAQVQCPTSITSVSKCIRADDNTSATASPARMPPQTTSQPQQQESQAPTKAMSSTQGCANIAYSQCDGKTFTGQKCCPPGYDCVRSDDYYSQCKLKSVTPASVCQNHQWQQCAGRDYKGETCCPEGTTCVILNQWYAQCQ